MPRETRKLTQLNDGIPEVSRVGRGLVSGKAKEKVLRLDVSVDDVALLDSFQRQRLK